MKPQSRRSRWVLLGFLAVAAVFLFSEHRAHLMGLLPYLLVLACPLMHFFHHGRHRGHQESDRAADADERSQARENPPGKP
jgi:hypothetical protein